ncbi:hypothetical protein MJO28_009707 [Puccinia striiformis f. sp. tritici]|uniref:Uncharacterized protein n=1 Tax=Puccinia striiformis f. sp. tritici TaxID=168172 RepID=A0ACC0EB40_9BASI|nr:hypothetical protein MJO28_009707 [Puccinia striiformis f. sp. tritici]
MTGYVELDPETQSRNIAAWTPVMVEVLHCFYSLDKETNYSFGTSTHSVPLPLPSPIHFVHKVIPNI